MNSISIDDRISIPRALKPFVVDILKSYGYSTSEEGHIYVSLNHSLGHQIFKNTSDYEQYDDKPVAFIGLGDNGLELELTNDGLKGFEKYHQELRSVFHVMERLKLRW